MKIKNKLESVKKIKELGLNTFPEELFKKGEEDKVKDFMDRCNADYFAVRSKEVVGYLPKIDLSKKEVMEEIKNHTLFTVLVSSTTFRPYLLLAGDIKIDKENRVWLEASEKGYIKFQKENPEINICTDIFDKKLDNIPGFDIIFKYIIEHNLLDVIVEFSVYDRPVGTKNEQAAIFEIRTDY